MTPFQEWLKHYQESHGVGKDNQSFEAQGDMVDAWNGALEYALEHIVMTYILFGEDVERSLKEWVVKLPLDKR